MKKIIPQRGSSIKEGSEARALLFFLHSEELGPGSAGVTAMLIEEDQRVDMH
jgi:hypothetical protein